MLLLLPRMPLVLLLPQMLLLLPAVVESLGVHDVVAAVEALEVHSVSQQVRSEWT